MTDQETIETAKKIGDLAEKLAGVVKLSEQLRHSPDEVAITTPYCEGFPADDWRAVYLMCLRDGLRTCAEGIRGQIAEAAQSLVGAESPKRGSADPPDCGACGGVGSLFGSGNTRRECPDCHGRGTMDVPRNQPTPTCAVCKGRGHVDGHRLDGSPLADVPCVGCAGTGVAR